MLVIERRPTHFYDCLCAIILEQGILLHFFPLFISSCLQDVATRQERSPLLVTRYGSGVLAMYDTFSPCEAEDEPTLQVHWGKDPAYLLTLADVLLMHWKCNHVARTSTA